MVTAADVADDAEYRDICEDVSEELKKFGQLQQLLVPRTGRFVGYIYAEFGQTEQASAAAGPLSARLFSGKQVGVAYETDASFAQVAQESK